MEIKNLNDKNFKDIVEPCICKKWVEKFAKNHNVNIKRVRNEFSRGAKLRINWIRERLPLGYRAKIAYEGERPIGFIDYLPIETEKDYVSGHDITLINCILIIPSRSYRFKGYGKLLLADVEADAKKVNKGIAVIAHNHPRWMSVSFFKKIGYKIVDEQNGEIKEMLMLKTFMRVEPPKFLKQKYEYHPKSMPGKVIVEIFWSSCCPHNLISVELLKKALKVFGDKVIIKEVATNDLVSDVIRKFGHGYGVYINGKPNLWLLSASKEAIYQEIEKNL
ncbi:MAG: GNAT family N-acetyltransferase [Candidatus Cloacimonetes bacterium]|nr:GNAT family N-acetyltransferase [Candidatus Cloacimonadota bacterium]